MNSNIVKVGNKREKIPLSFASNIRIRKDFFLEVFIPKMGTIPVCNSKIRGRVGIAPEGTPLVPPMWYK